MHNLMLIDERLDAGNCFAKRRRTMCFHAKPREQVYLVGYRNL